MRGRGECPDPAAGYLAGVLAQLARAPSPAPASSCTAIVSFSRGQAIYGYLTRRLTAPGGTKNTSGKRASLAEARPIRPVIDQNSRSMLLCACTAARHLPARGEKALNFRCKKLQKTLRRRGEGNAAGSYLMRTAARAFREPAGLRSWAALGLQRVLLELPFVGLGQQAGHLGAACFGLDRPHSYGSSPCRARTSFWTCQRCQKVQRTHLAATTSLVELAKRLRTVPAEMLA